MSSRLVLRFWLWAAVAVAVAGAVDAALGEVWDLFAILVALLVILVGAQIVTSTGRPTVTIRPDLERWLRQRAVIEGEPLEALVDRSVATYREQLRPTGRRRVRDDQ